MPRKKHAGIVEFLLKHPDWHEALRAMEAPPKQEKPPKPLSERMILARKYRLTSGAKQCRFRHQARIWRAKAPKRSGVEYFCTRCVKLYRRKRERLAAEQARALADGRTG